jgi:ADP-heptose:LPS heptosyltransferase
MFRAVKERYPQSVLHVLGNAVNRELLKGNSNVDTYIVKEASFIQTLRMLRKCNIDAACITVPSFELLALCMIARIPHIIAPRIENGWSPYFTRTYRVLLRFVTVVPHRMEYYTPREYLRLLEPLNIYTDDTQKEVFFTPDSLKKVHAFFSATSAYREGVALVGILPGAGNEIKSWPPEYFAELMNAIQAEQQNVVFVLLGAGKDAERAAVVHSKIDPAVTVVDAIGKFSLDELKADTGPQYIAEALGIPTIDIVGPVDEREQPPMGEIHKIVKAERKKPELYVLNARVYNEVEARRQVLDTTPQMVLEVYQSFTTSQKHDTHLRPKR